MNKKNVFFSDIDNDIDNIDNIDKVNDYDTSILDNLNHENVMMFDEINHSYKHQGNQNNHINHIREQVLQEATETIADLWEHCLLLLKDRFSAEKYQTFIMPLQVVESHKTRLVLAAPNPFKQKWVKENAQEYIRVVAAELMGDQYFACQVILLQHKTLTQPIANYLREHPEKKSEIAHLENQNEQNFSNHQNHQSPLTDKTKAVSQKEILSKNVTNTSSNVTSSNMTERYRVRLNDEFTFDRFVVGEANHFAYAAAKQVTEHLGKGNNPLFIYGGVGLGKTHLMQAVGHSLLQKSPQSRIKYIQTQTFEDDVVRSIKSGEKEKFMESYYALDLLLIDDIQFIGQGDKERTKREFLHLFEALVNRQKHIIMTSDKMPKQLKGLEERLVSRFDSGLAVMITKPDAQTRQAILLKKAETENFVLPTEVAFFIAQNIDANVRELTGALNKIRAAANLMGKTIDIDLAKIALKDQLEYNQMNRMVSIDKIVKTVSEFYRISLVDLKGKTRIARISQPRQIAMYLSKMVTEKSLQEIGRYFNRDHSTVLHAVNKLIEERQNNAELDHNLHLLEQTIRH